MSIYKFKIKFSRDRGKGHNILVPEEDNFHPKPSVYEEGDKRLIILGSPIYREKIDNITVAKELLSRRIDVSFASQFNGSFLFILYDRAENAFTIINDRFASIPLYYFFNDTQFVASVNYADIWSELYGTKDFAINKEAFYEFIHLQRLLGDKTYDAKSRYLNSASILTFDLGTGRLVIAKYWRPDFSKRPRSAGETSRILADLTVKAVSERTADGKKYGLLLSGGLDSRLVLGAFKNGVECFTVGPYKNNEYLVAKSLADARRSPHTFLQRQESHYTDILEEAVYLGGAMNMYVHAHFLNLDKDIRAKADVVFHGHGFDYMFQGKYLPYETVRLLNKKTYIGKKIPLRKNMEEQFLSGISYRLKSVDPLSVVEGAEKDRMREAIHFSAVQVTDEARHFCDAPYDLWEYLIMHNLSRHYTFLNLCSIRTITEERTIAFDNDLFDFYLSMPAGMRRDKKVFTDAIRLLSEKLYRIKNANTNFNIYDSDLTLTVKLSANKILRQFGLGAILPPSQKDRSWPVKADILTGSGKMRSIVMGLAGSAALDALGFLDMDAVRACIEKHLAGKADHSDLILTLITIDAFMKNSLKKKDFSYVGYAKD